MIDRRKLKVLRKHRGAMFGLALLAGLILFAATVGFVSPYEPGHMDADHVMEKPSKSHVLGTDDTGRDVYTRLGHGGRVSLLIGLAAVGLSMAIGVPLGALAGYVGGWIDMVVSRVLEVMLALPTILLAILIAVAIGKGMAALILAVGIVGIPQFARQVRGSVLALREQDFVQASRALGAPPARTLFREVIPNAIGPII